MHHIIPPLDLRSCLVSVRGETIYEHFRNEEAATHIAKINSCTKSVLSALICIAMDQGMLPDASTPISTFFPQLKSDPDPRKAEITLEQLLTMTAGFNWDEFGGQNSFPRMTRTDHWVNFALEQHLSHSPGTHMEYNSGVSQILSAILMQSTDMSVAEFAERYLFGPLGIHQYEWEVDPQGIHTGGFGLKMLPGDLLKFGQLFLQKGMWNDQSLISSDLVIRSTQPAIKVTPPNHGSYAWHWWVDVYSEETTALSDASISSEQNQPSLGYYYARGFGGQFVYIVPALELVTVLTNDKRKKEKPPLDVFPKRIAPQLVKLL
ncbi:serine hydrolase domain-containing protein [Paenibacillus pabuli]|uniref:serine hydrolase domain-containing protein n=1 Tax=Paenibacillus pabuli TaxID=1472 RepID=UPI001FE20809|nr:serine hydrolase [Paenibacillus pabuli]MEC0127578.1 serine hydrolase [Paenibacillus pabuli]